MVVHVFGLANSLLFLTLATGATSAYNVLHVLFDDLRPEIGAYGVPEAHTPNIDKLAAGGVTFDRAYCQQAVCGPSRNSFLTGRRPDRSRSWNFINHFREDHPEWTTLPGLFLRHGREARGSGKSYHPNVPPAYDGNKSWSKKSLPYYNPCWNTADNPHIPFQDGGLPCVFCPADIKHYVLHSNLSVVTEQCPIDAYEDVKSVNEGIKYLQEMSREGLQGWYLAVGFHKPHLPHQAAKEDFDKNPLESVPVAKHPLPPKNVPDIAMHYDDGSEHTSPWDPIPQERQRQARRGYRAAITGVDRKLGWLLDELDHLGLANNTAVVLHADHALQFGEHGLWQKFTNFELAVRVPLIVRAPWIQGSAGRRSAQLVELVDVLPTIAELAGLELPSDETPFDGTSLVPLLQSQIIHKTAAFSQYPRRVVDPTRPWKSNEIIHQPREKFTHMGYTMRTELWRYTEWVAWDQVKLLPIWSQVVARELYDHRNETVYPTDFDAGENENIAGEAAFQDVVNKLSVAIREQYGPGSDRGLLEYI